MMRIKHEEMTPDESISQTTNRTHYPTWIGHDFTHQRFRFKNERTKHEIQYDRKWNKQELHFQWRVETTAGPYRGHSDLMSWSTERTATILINATKRCRKRRVVWTSGAIVTLISYHVQLRANRNGLFAFHQILDENRPHENRPPVEVQRSQTRQILICVISQRYI